MVDPTYKGPAQYHLPGEAWICSIGTWHLVKQLSAQICMHVNGVPATKYWKTKFQLSDSQWHSINWAGIGRSYQELSTTMHHWAVKYTLGFFAHGKNMAQWHFQSSMKCPRCTMEIKDKAHITQCPSKEATQTWLHSLKQLKKWFKRATQPMKLPMPSSGASTDGITHKRGTLHQPVHTYETKRH